MNTKAISYVYLIIGLTFILVGIAIGILANLGIFEQTITSEVLPLFNTYVMGSILTFLLVLIGVLVLVFGHRN